MQRSVYLQGELGERFGTKFSMNASTCSDIFKCINANRPKFKYYLIDCQEKDVGLGVSYQEESISEEDLLTPLKEGDVFISLVPAGSKSGIGKILAAVVLVTIGLPMLSGALGSAAAIGPNMTWGAMIKAGANTFMGKIAVGLATNLAIAGISQVMAPDPEDDINPENYLFNGSSQNIKEGDPVPVLYGELRVPGRPIAINIINGKYTNPTSILEYDGSISAQNVETTDLAGE